ncbi:hypothetical protein [Myxococcus xanthus]|uniref:hypothetical protein n=1 Tax=Myxococcus xanthus TaxID=34 RepID=UPI00112CFDA0|nr:hypothetical protein [Myxococcus xanthus]
MKWSEQAMREDFSRREGRASGCARADRRTSKKGGTSATLAAKQADQWAAREDIYRTVVESNRLKSRAEFLAWLREQKNTPTEPGSEVISDDAYNEAFQDTIDELLKEFGN